MVKRKAIQQITPNVITISKAAADAADPFLSLDGKRFHFFRSNSDYTTYIAGLPSQLANEDVLAINATCDRSEGSRNRSVKESIAQTLSSCFRGTSFRLTELGCGAHPILDYFPNADIAYHGVELDPAHVNHVQTKLKLSASDWQGIPDLPDGKPSLCVSVYALHFMLKRSLPEEIGRLISKDGVFIANLYLDAQETKDHRQSTYLDRLLRTSKMEYRRVSDGRFNEYWLVSHAGSGGRLDDIAGTLRATIAQNRPQSQDHVARSYVPAY